MMVKLIGKTLKEEHHPMHKSVVQFFVLSVQSFLYDDVQMCNVHKRVFKWRAFVPVSEGN